MTRTAATILAIVLLVAACGDSSGTVGETSPPDTVAATTQPAPTTTAAPTTTTTAPPTTTTTVPPTTTTIPPTTTSTTAAPAPVVPGADPEVDAIVTAYEIAFDSVSTYEEKAPYIDDPTGLEDTVTAYLAAGAAVGGIGVAATAVGIDGDTATVVYDLLFAGNPTYPNLRGSAVKTADGWKVPRSVFCSLMSSARVGCPAA